MYKLKRLWDLAVLDKEFTKREAKQNDESIGDFFEDNYMLKAVFSKSVEYRLAEEYGNKCYIESDKGLMFEQGFTNYDYMLSWVLSYGNDVEVLEPRELIEHLKDIAKEQIKNTNNINVT